MTWTTGDGTWQAQYVTDADVTLGDEYVVQFRSGDDTDRLRVERDGDPLVTVDGDGVTLTDAVTDDAENVDGDDSTDNETHDLRSITNNNDDN